MTLSLKLSIELNPNNQQTKIISWLKSFAMVESVSPVCNQLQSVAISCNQLKFSWTPINRWISRMIVAISDGSITNSNVNDQCPRPWGRLNPSGGCLIQNVQLVFNIDALQSTIWLTGMLKHRKFDIRAGLTTKGLRLGLSLSLDSVPIWSF